MLDSRRPAARSWMGLCAGAKINGGKVMNGKTNRCANRVAQALRLAAAALFDDDAIGAPLSSSHLGPPCKRFTR